MIHWKEEDIIGKIKPTCHVLVSSSHPRHLQSVKFVLSPTSSLSRSLHFQIHVDKLYFFTFLLHVNRYSDYRFRTLHRCPPSQPISIYPQNFYEAHIFFKSTAMKVAAVGKKSEILNQYKSVERSYCKNGMNVAYYKSCK